MLAEGYMSAAVRGGQPFRGARHGAPKSALASAAAGVFASVP